MKFIKVKTKISKNISDHSINYEELGLPTPQDEIETKEDYIFLSIEGILDEILLIIPDEDKCIIELKDGTKLEVFISAEELIEKLNDTK